jgi:predicted AAA+ superfamily ATPase
MKRWQIALLYSNLHGNIELMVKRILTLPNNNSFFLFGARQTGKSTLVNEFLGNQNAIEINLLEDDQFEKYSKRPSTLRDEVEAREHGVSKVFIDEIQKVPQLLDEVQALLFKYEREIEFCMSGSSARKLKSAGANLLAGRAWTFNLYPLTHLELGNKFSLDKVLRFGSLPSVALMESEQDITRTLKSYVETYLKEEIQRETEIRNIGGFLRFLQIAADLNGELLNFSDIGRDAGISYATAKSYFQVLEDTLIGNFLLPYSGKVVKRLKRAPKFYFFDLGVKRSLEKKLSVAVEPRTTEYGKCFEHFLINEILHLSRYKELEDDFSYYQTSNSAEVDLIIKKPDGAIFAIEIKSGENPGPGSFRGLYSFKELFPKANLICACNSRQDQKRGDVLVVPWKELIRILGLD